MTIDFNWLAQADGWNDEGEMWQHYRDVKKWGSKRIGYHLGIAAATILNRWRRLGYEINPQGGYHRDNE